MASASAQSLLGLMNQLQSLESSFISVLMEAALKLSAITDTSVFLLVETKEGRRISGKRHLCDAYLRGALLPVGNDVEYDVDPSVVALQRRQTSPAMLQQQLLQQQNQQRYSPTTLGDFDDFSHGGSPLSTIGRGGGGGGGGGENPLKRSSSSLVSVVPLPTKQSRNHFGSPTPRRPSCDQQQQQQQHQHLIAPSADDVEVKIEQNDIFKLEPYLPRADAAAADAASTNSLLDDTVSSLTPPTSHPNSSVNNHDDVLEDGDIAEIIEEHPATTTTTTTGGSPATAGDASLVDEGAAALLEAYQANVPFILPTDFAKKLEALQTMRTPSVFEKLSIEHRLFTSCVYQLGSLLAKHVVANAADYQSSNLVEDFFNHHVTLWLSNFPYLSESESRGLRVDTGKGGMTINGFVRHRARNSFRKGCLMNANKANLSVTGV